MSFILSNTLIFGTESPDLGNKDPVWWQILTTYYSFFAISFFLGYTFVSMSFILYVLAIGKTSVITFGFYGFLSLLPSFAVAGLSWFFKARKKDSETNKGDYKSLDSPA